MEIENAAITSDAARDILVRLRHWLETNSGRMPKPTVNSSERAENEEAQLFRDVASLVRQLDKSAAQFSIDVINCARQVLLPQLEGLQTREEEEWCAGLADDDAMLDPDKQFLQVEVQLRRLLIRKQEVRVFEEEVRGMAADSAGFQSLAGREAILMPPKSCGRARVRLTW